MAQTADSRQGTPAKHRRKVHTAAAATQADIQALKEQMAAQQQEIQQLMDQLKQNTQQLQESQQALQQAQSAASQAQGQATAAQSSAQQSTASVGQLQNQVATLATSTAATQKQVAAVQKSSESALTVANGKIKLSGMVFGQYGAYLETGFGPQFVTQTNFPGPGGKHYNSFDVTRAYLNFYYSPNDKMTLRITPNVYRQVAGAACATSTAGETCSATQADKIGKATGYSGSVDGNLALRLKFAYIDFPKIFSSSENFQEDSLTIGQQTNPLLDWEEGLYGFRFTSLTPWNYLGFSSVDDGVSLHGPIKINGKQYLDYAVGAFDQANFHQFEQAESKQGMARMSYYPFGADSKYQGFGLTGFIDYGWKNVAPDLPNAPLYRVAALAHWQSEKNGYGIAGEYDTGRNAFSSGNLFSGSAPADEFSGLVATPTPYANLDGLAKALLGQNGAFLQDVALFGHAAVPNSPFTFFGLYNYTRPNTNVIRNPFDFQRTVLGLSYRMNDHLKFALDGQNLNSMHSQFTFPAAELKAFSPSLAKKNPGGIVNAVPNDTGAIFINSEFDF